MMIAYTLWRKDYTNSLYVVRLGPRLSAEEKKRTTGNRREKRKKNRRKRGTTATRRAGAAAGIRRQNKDREMGGEITVPG